MHSDFLFCYYYDNVDIGGFLSLCDKKLKRSEFLPSCGRTEKREQVHCLICVLCWCVCVCFHRMFRFFRCLFPFWRTQEQKTIKSLDTRPFRVDDVVHRAREMSLGRAFFEERNRFHDCLEKVTSLIPDAALEMKASRAGRLFEACLLDVRDASFKMKQRRARRVMESVLPELRGIATLKHTHRLNVKTMLPQIVSVGGTKNRHRMSMNRIIVNDEIGHMLGVFSQRNMMRKVFRETVLPQIQQRVYQRHLLTQRLQYASVWEKILYDIRVFPKDQKTTKNSTHMHTKAIFDLYVMFFIALFCGAYMVSYGMMLVVTNVWSVVYTMIDTQLSVLEQMYIKNQPRSCRRLRRQQERKMRKIRYV